MNNDEFKAGSTRRLLDAVANKILAEVDFNIAATLFQYSKLGDTSGIEIEMCVTLPITLPKDLISELEKRIEERGWEKCTIVPYFLPMYIPSVDTYDSQRTEVETKLQVLKVVLRSDLLIQGINCSF